MPTIPAQRSEPSGALAPIRYTVSDGLHIAYQVTGGGDLDIVLISGFVSHLELDWADPRHAHFLDRLGSMGRLIRFDKRGTGMSDRPPGLPDLETRMHDVLAVMDAVGSERAVALWLLRGRCRWRCCWPRRTRSGSAHSCCTAATPRRTWAPDYPWARTAGGAPRVHRAARHRLGLGGRLPAPLPLGRRGDAAMVGPADAGGRDAVDDPGADGHELAGRRARRAGRRPRPDPGAAPHRRRHVPRGRRALPRRAHPRRAAASCSTATTTSCAGDPDQILDADRAVPRRPAGAGRAARAPGCGRRGRRRARRRGDRWPRRGGGPAAARPGGSRGLALRRPGDCGTRGPGAPRRRRPASG